MGAKTLPEDIEELELVLDKGEVINFVHTGYCEGRSISFLHLVTSDGKEMKWGSLENLVKSEQKHIKRYESCFIKSKFLQPEGE